MIPMPSPSPLRRLGRSPLPYKGVRVILSHDIRAEQSVTVFFSDSRDALPQSWAVVPISMQLERPFAAAVRYYRIGLVEHYD